MFLDYLLFWILINRNYVNVMFLYNVYIIIDIY